MPTRDTRSVDEERHGRAGRPGRALERHGEGAGSRQVTPATGRPASIYCKGTVPLNVELFVFAVTRLLPYDWIVPAALSQIPSTLW